jgi:hypothetical protein
LSPKVFLSPILLAVRSKVLAPLLPEPTQHNSLDRLQTTEINHFFFCVSGYTKLDRNGVFVSQQLPTVWPNTVDLFRANNVVTYLLQLPYDLSIRAVDKTYLIELVRDVLLFGTKETKKLPQQRSQAETKGEIKLYGKN